MNFIVDICYVVYFEILA